MNNIVTIKKTDSAEQIVYGEVYVPMVPDSDGDFMTAETIKKCAYAFMKHLRLSSIDVEHSNDPIDAQVVESYIAKEDDSIFVPGAWVMGVHISDAEYWEAVEKGELNGFSLQGKGIYSSVEVEIDVPEQVTGITAKSAGHSHTFSVGFSGSGEYLGGHTKSASGHKHDIVHGTATEVFDGHTHRFAFVGVTLNE